MLDEVDLEYALEKNIIDDETKALIIEYNERLAQNNVPIIYNLRHLRKLLHIKKSEQERFFGKDRQQSYNKFNIPKKSGGVRIIEAPVNDLKAIQKWIKDNILDKFEASKYAKGFIKNISIYDNALPHVNKELVINLDLKDFFHLLIIHKYLRYLNILVIPQKFLIY